MKLLLSILLSVTVNAQLDSTSLWLGAQNQLHITAVSNNGEQVTLPVFAEEITPDLEIVDRSGIDRKEQKSGQVTLSQDYTITAFKDSLFLIPALPFVVDNDTIFSQPVSLNVVQPFVLDTTYAITDIKPIQKATIYWWGILRWVLLLWLIAGIAVIAYYIYLRLSHKDAAQEETIDPELLRPCDEVAIEKLDKIKEEKKWEEGKQKEYFSELTFVIREYIGRRYGIRSTEKTSDQTLQSIRPILVENEQKPLYEQLDRMLRLADLVKFAKWRTTPDEDMLSLKAAYNFVNETKHTEEEKPQQQEVN